MSPSGHAAEVPALNLSQRLPCSVAEDIAHVYGSLPRFPETGSVLLGREIRKPGVPQQCQTSTSQQLSVSQGGQVGLVC